MEDGLKCQISPLVKYRQNQKKSTSESAATEYSFRKRIKIKQPNTVNVQKQHQRDNQAQQNIGHK